MRGYLFVSVDGVKYPVHHIAWCCTTKRLLDEELLRAEDQKLSCPESHSSCHNAAGDELSAKKQVVKMAPTVKPTPITINAVSPCSSVSGRLSTKRRFAIDWISLLTFCQSNQLSSNRPFYLSTEWTYGGWGQVWIIMTRVLKGGLLASVLFATSWCI